MAFEIENIVANSGDPADALLYKCFSRLMYNGFIRIFSATKSYVLPYGYLDYKTRIDNFAIRSDDTFVISHPKTGTTWTLEMVWCIVNNCNFKVAKEVDIHYRAPQFDLCSYFRKIAHYFHPIIRQCTFKLAEEASSPRVLKTHLPYELLPKQLLHGNGRIIYVTRNVNDTCVSYYHFSRYIFGYSGTLEEFVEIFSSNKMVLGGFWDHVLGYWDHRKLPNLLFITYEEMQTDLRSVILRVAEFLNKPITEDQMNQLVKHLSFKEMKANKSVNWMNVANKVPIIVRGEGVFMRSGKSGIHKEVLDDDMIFKIGKMTYEGTKNTDFDLDLVKIKTPPCKTDR